MNHEQEFRQIYDLYNEMVYNLSLNYLQNVEDAEEAAQDVFVKIFERIDQFKQDANIRTWIYRITINTCLDRIKAAKRKKRLGFLSNFLDAEASDKLKSYGHFDHPGIALENKETMEQLFALINKLPEKQKTALLLAKTEGLSQKEISTILDTTPKAVESLIQRARNTLKSKWKKF